MTQVQIALAARYGVEAPFRPDHTTPPTELFPDKMDEVNNKDVDARPLGNIATDSIKEIYKGMLYKDARRLVTDPPSSGPIADHFLPRLLRHSKVAQSE